MDVKRLRLLFCLAAIGLSASTIEAQTSPTQGYPQIGPPTYSYSALYLDASQFCTNGFDFVNHTCLAGGNMWQAIKSAIGSAQNVSNIIDARAFAGNQIIPASTGTTALYGNLTSGSTVPGTLLLGNVQMYCDGPSGGSSNNYTDGSGSNYGTPCIILPNGYQIIGENPNQTTFSVCTGSGTPISGCSNAYPLRQFPVSSLSFTAGSHTLAGNGTFQATGGPPTQNIYVGELGILTSSTCTAYNLLRIISGASSTAFSIQAPTGTGTCGSTGTLTLLTPIIGFGYQGVGIPYQPTRPSSLTSQSFRQHLINVGFNLQDYQGAIAIQVLSTGENSTIEHGYCKLPSAGYLDVGTGSNEFGPVVDVYCETTTSSLTHVTPGTFGIYNAAANAGFHRTTFTYHYNVGPPSQQPNSAIYNDGSAVSFDGEPHNEGTVDAIELAPNGSVSGVTIAGIVGPPCPTSSNPGNPGLNLVHIVSSGNSTASYTVSATTIGNLIQQQGGSCTSNGSTNAVADDIHNNNVTDQFLSRYEFDSSGDPVSGATLQSNTFVTTINGSGLAAGGPASGTNGSLTLNGSTSGSAAITVSSTGTLALPSGTTATSMVLTTPNLGTPSAAILTNATGLPLGTGLTATFSPPLSLSVNTLSCPTCVTSTSALTNTAIMTGAGSQGSQTPSATATLSGTGNMSLPGTITSGSAGTGGSLTLNGSSSGSASVSASGTGGNLQLNSTSTFVDTTGSLTVGRHLNQNAANTFAGSCTMSAGTTCTFSITATFSGTPLTFVSQDGSSTLVNTAGKCSVSTTTVTITAFTSNSNKWDCLIIGNPN